MREEVRKETRREEKKHVNDTEEKNGGEGDGEQSEGGILWRRLLSRRWSLLSGHPLGPQQRSPLRRQSPSPHQTQRFHWSLPKPKSKTKHPRPFSLFLLLLLISKYIINLLFTHYFLHFWAEAVSDANKAIHLNPSLSKAYLRKGYVIVCCCCSSSSFTSSIYHYYYVCVPQIESMSALFISEFTGPLVLSSKNITLLRLHCKTVPLLHQMIPDSPTWFKNVIATLQVSIYSYCLWFL